LEFPSVIVTQTDEKKERNHRVRLEIEKRGWEWGYWTKL